MKYNSKRLVTMILTVAMGLGLIACGDSREVSDKDEFRIVKMNSYKGEVSLERDGDDEDIFEGIQLMSKDSVTTGNESLCELLVDSDKHIIASADTNFDIKASGDEDKGKVTIKVNYGETLIAIDNKLNEKSEFMVNTPNASLSVRGTVFNVYCDGENTAVIVTEGTVWGTNGSGEEVVIEAGNGAVITEDEVITGTIEEIADRIPEVTIDEEIENKLFEVRGIDNNTNIENPDSEKNEENEEEGTEREIDPAEAQREINDAYHLLQEMLAASTVGGTPYYMMSGRELATYFESQGYELHYKDYDFFDNGDFNSLVVYNSKDLMVVGFERRNGLSVASQYIDGPVVFSEGGFTQYVEEHGLTSINDINSYFGINEEVYAYNGSFYKLYTEIDGGYLHVTYGPGKWFSIEYYDNEDEDMENSNKRLGISFSMEDNSLRVDEFYK